MKKLLFLFIALVSVKAYAQFPIDSVSKKITYTEVIAVPGATKADLYARAKSLNAMLSNVVKDNKTEGIYSYKGSYGVKYPAPQVGMSHNGTVNYTVTVICKDGKYKYVVTDLTHASDKGNGGPLEGSIPACGKYTLTPSGWKSIKNQSLEKMQELVKSIKSAMDNPGGTPATSTDF